MKHYVIAYDKKTEDMVYEVEIPSTYLTTLFTLMDWKEEEDQIHVYNLSTEQLVEIGKMTNRDFSKENYFFQLNCFA